MCLKNDEINALASYLKISKKNITSALYITENEKKNVIQLMIKHLIIQYLKK